VTVSSFLILSLSVACGQKVSVHLMTAVQKHAKTFSTVSITYHNKVVELGIPDGVSVSFVSPLLWRSAAKQSH
jgi:hypothetical protein